MITRYDYDEDESSLFVRYNNDGRETAPIWISNGDKMIKLTKKEACFVFEQLNTVLTD